MSAPAVALLIHGAAPDAASTIRAIRTGTHFTPRTVYLVLDHPPTEALNQSAAVRTESLLLILEGGLSPMHPDWLSRMVQRLQSPSVGAVVGTLAAPASGLAGLLIARETFDLLGGFDADRFPVEGYLEDFLARLIGLGRECIAADGVEFLAGSTQLKRAG